MCERSASNNISSSVLISPPSWMFHSRHRLLQTSDSLDKSMHPRHPANYCLLLYTFETPAFVYLLTLDIVVFKVQIPVDQLACQTFDTYLAILA